MMLKNEMAEYKSISKHIWLAYPTLKTIHPRSFRLSISSTLFSVVSCLFSHNGARFL